MKKISRNEIRQIFLAEYRKRLNEGTEVKSDVLSMLATSPLLLQLYAVSSDARAEINAAAERGEGAIKKWWEQNEKDWRGVLSKLKSVVTG